MADTQRIITNEDFLRRYNLQDLKKNSKIIQTLDQQLTNTYGIIKDYITVMVNYESKEQYYLSGVPTLENLPASEWTTPENHLNTIYYDVDNGKAYIFKYDEEYYWEELNDSFLLNILSIANGQTDTANDNLRRIFYEQPTVPYSAGDIWVNGSNIYRCKRGEVVGGTYHFDDWVDYTQYKEEMASSNAIRQLNQFKETVETEYVTNAVLEAAEDEINASVTRVENVAKSKNKVFTSEPTTPYYRGDSYIKQVTDEETGITMNLIYVCQQSRETGTFHEEDFAVQPGYATLSQLKVTNDAVTSTVAEVAGQNTKISQIQQTTEEINAKIQNIANITVTETTETGYLEINGANASEPIEIVIIPRIDDISQIYPSTVLYPSTSLFLKNRTLYIENTTDETEYSLELPGDLLYYDEETYDEFVLHYGDGTESDPQYYEIIHRVGKNADGTKYALENDYVEQFPYVHIALTDGDYEFILEGYNRAYMKVTLMASNIYTTQFATKIELNSAITQKANEINLEVNKRIIGFDANGNRTDDVMSSINLSPGTIKINADKIDITGTITAINNDVTTTIDGNKITTGTITANEIESRTITAEKIVAGTLTANEIADSTITNAKILNGTIEGSKIKSATITNSHLVDATIEGSKIKGGTITGAKIADATITNSKIESINAGKITTGTMSADRIYGGTINGNNINITNLNASNISAGTINANRIPNISADKITTGTLSADRVRGGTLSGTKVTANSGKIGCWNISSSNIHSSYVRLDNQNCVYIGSSISSASTWYNIIRAGQQVSDRRKKKKIKDLELKYDKFYDELKPVEFYYKANAQCGDKKHLGFIAQDIEESLKSNQIDDMAMIWQEDEYYNLDKRELIALNVWQIQKLKKRVEELEEKYGKATNNKS